MKKYLGLAPLLLAPTTALGAVDYDYTVQGAYTVSADAGGSNTATTYNIQVNKPAGATVHKAFAITMNIPGSTAPGVNALTYTQALNVVTPSLDLTRTSQLSDAITSRFDDVTTELEALLNGLPTGVSSIAVTENAATGNLDGSALLVIWNDPSQANNVVSVRLGAQRTDAGITHTVAFPAAVVKSAGFRAVVGAGISFSTGDSSQISRLAVNGTTVSSLVGGYEDGAYANGALISLGGVGDTLSAADNDELYDVTTFVDDGDTAIDVAVTSSSTNDYLFATYVTLENFSGLGITAPTEGALTNTDPVFEGYAVANATVDVVIKDANDVTVFATSVVANANGLWTVPAQNLVDGTYTVTATSGNETDTNTFTIDTVAPIVTLDAPTDGTLTNDNTVTFSGTAEADADITVTVFDSTMAVVAVLNTTADVNGTWTVDSAALPDDSYTVSATATDDAQNTSPSTTATSFTVDTTPPAIALLAPANPTITNDNTLDVVGTAEPGAAVVVTIFDDVNMIAETLNTTADANGDWTVTSTTLADGAYVVEAAATDAAGNSDAADPSLVLIDTIPPGMLFYAPVAGASQNNTPTVSGATEAGQSVTIEIVDANGTVVFTDTQGTDGNGDWLTTSTTLPDGTYTATATATDLAGNTSSDTVTFTVDTVAPVVDVTGPVDGSFISETQPTLTGVTEPGVAVSVTLTDANGTVHTADVTADATTGIWTVDVPVELADGDYTVSVTATDEAGNVGTDESTFTVDTTVLPLEISAPTAGSVTSDATPTFTGTTAPDVEVTLVLTTMGGTEVLTTTVTADGNGDWSFTPDTDLPEGSYDVTATVTTRADVTTTANTNVTVDTTGPSLTIDTPIDGNTLGDNTPTVSGTAEAGSTVTVALFDDSGNEVQNTTPTINADGTFSVDTTELPDGTYTVVVTATDEAGNETVADTVTFTIDTTAPDVTITAPTGDVDDVTTVTGTSEPGATVDVVITDADGNEVASGQVTADANGAWSLPVDAEWTAGEYTVSATATDDVGNVSEATTTTFTVGEDTTVDPPSQTANFEVEGGCSTTDSSAGSTIWLALLGLLGLRRRR